MILTLRLRILEICSRRVESKNTLTSLRRVELGLSTVTDAQIIRRYLSSMEDDVDNLSRQLRKACEMLRLEPDEDN